MGISMKVVRRTVNAEVMVRFHDTQPTQRV